MNEKESKAMGVVGGGKRRSDVTVTEEIVCGHEVPKIVKWGIQSLGHLEQNDFIMHVNQRVS